MEIINTFEVPIVIGSTWGISPLCSVSFFALIAVIMIGITIHYIIHTIPIKDIDDYLMLCFLFISLILFIGFFILGFHGKYIYDTQTQYEVRLEDITAKAFLNNYTILEENGNTYIITEKEP